MDFFRCCLGWTSAARQKFRDFVWEKLFGALDAIWLRQPDSFRIRVHPSRRRDVHRALERARTLLETARTTKLGVGRDTLETEALRTLLAVVARSQETSETDTATAVGHGIAKVEGTLGSGELRALLSSSGAPDPRVPLHERSRAVRKACDWIDHLIDNRSERERRLGRILPWATGALVLVATAYCLFSLKNLALGKSVSASSVCGVTPPPPLAKERLARVVDGNTAEGRLTRAYDWGQSAFAMCTELEVKPWVTVDLAKEHTIRKVVIYNRSDCCWGQSDLPLSIQVSLDNKNFATVATRHEPFTADFPWTASIGGRRARYVRLYNATDEMKNIVFSEMAIYGR